MRERLRWLARPVEEALVGSICGLDSLLLKENHMFEDLDLKVDEVIPSAELGTHTNMDTDCQTQSMGKLCC